MGKTYIMQAIKTLKTWSNKYFHDTAYKPYKELFKVVVQKFKKQTGLVVFRQFTNMEWVNF